MVEGTSKTSVCHAVVTNSARLLNIYSLERRRVVRSLAVSDPSLSNELTRVSWSPDGSRLAVAGPDVHLFNAVTDAVLATYHLDKESLVGNLDWSPDSTMIACQPSRAYGSPGNGTKDSRALVNV